MRGKNIAVAVIVLVFVGAMLRLAFAAQNRFTLKAPDGIAFAEFRGYDAWQDVAVSTTTGSVKAILGNPAMIKAFKEGVPENGKAFPDGSKIVKIEWIKKKNPVAPYFVEVPDTLKTISFIEKDSKRFPESSGWGYAEFLYDPATKTFKPYGDDSSFGKKICYQCHTRVADRDYIFTHYPPR